MIKTQADPVNLPIRELDGGTYRLQFTDTLTPTNWQDLPGASVMVDSNGVFQFVDTTGTPTRYYRSVYP